MFRTEAEDLVAVLGYVSAAIAAGQPLPRAMEVLAQRAEGRAREPLAALARDLASGDTLSTALARRWPHAAPFTLALVRAGEASANLAEALDTLCTWHQTSRRLSQRLASATLYPRMVVFLAVAVVLPMMAWARATLTSAISLLNLDSPSMWQLLSQGKVLRFVFELPRLIFLPYDLGVVGWLAMAVPAWLLLVRPVGATAGAAEWLCQRMFLIGPTLRNTLAAQFTTALALLLRAGIPMDRAVSLIADFTGGPSHREAFAEIVRQLARGAPLSDAVARCRQLPASLAWMVALGERGGNLEACLAEAGRYYRGETEFMLDLVTQSIEPVLLAAAALVLAPALMSTFSAMLSAINGVS